MESKFIKFSLIIFSLMIAGNIWASFTNQNTVVLDNMTNLMWEKKTNNNKSDQYNWEDAISYCENLTLAGYSDWRLPSITELTSITDLNRYAPAINTDYFPNTQSDWYWSSTSYADDLSNAWHVDFSYGNDSWYNKTNTYYVRTKMCMSV